MDNNNNNNLNNNLNKKQIEFENELKFWPEYELVYLYKNKKLNKKLNNN